MDNSENREDKIESLIENSKKIKAEQKAEASKKSGKKGGNYFLAPSFIMSFICCLAVVVCLVATGVTAWRISDAKNAENTTDCQWSGIIALFLPLNNTKGTLSSAFLF